MLRFSSYTIITDQLQSGAHVMMNGCSGALDLIPASLATLIQHTIATSPYGQAYAKWDSMRSDTLVSFIDRGHLTELSHTEEQILAAEIAGGLHEFQANQPYFMIVPSMDCNYRCTPCFERYTQKRLNSEKSSISYQKGNVVMRRDFVPRIYDCIGSLQSYAGRDAGGTVILYGGEPLNADNLDLVLDIVHAGREQNYEFAAITNGHDLDKFLPIIRPDMLNQIQVSIDGPWHVHDKHRIHRNKEPSFDKLVSNINTVLGKGGAEIQVRVQVDPSNISLFEEILAFFEDQGWLNNQNVIVYSSTVYKKGNDGHVCANMEVGEVSRKLSSIALRYKNVFTDAPAVHAGGGVILPVFEKGGRFGRKGACCSASTGNYIFAPDGNLYACWESIGKKCGRIGSYTDPGGIMLDEAAMGRWINRNVGAVSACTECAYALVCGRGCAQYAECDTGVRHRPYCDDFKRGFRQTLAKQMEVQLTRNGCANIVGLGKVNAWRGSPTPLYEGCANHD